MPTTLLDRIRQLVQESGRSQRGFAIAAGLSPNYLGTLLTRLRNDPDATVDGTSAAKLARAGGVSLDWLLTGEGQPAAARMVEGDPRYPNRAEAARIARDGGVAEEAIESVLAEAHKLAEDPPVLVWIDRMRLREGMLRAQRRFEPDAKSPRPSSPEPHDGPDDLPPRRRRRRP